MDPCARTRRGVRSSARVELDPLDIPATLLRQVQESPRVRSDVEKTTAPEWNAARKLAENAIEDQIFIGGGEFVFDPLWRPSLVIHAVKVGWECGQRFGLTESARLTADEPDVLAGI